MWESDSVVQRRSVGSVVSFSKRLEHGKPPGSPPWRRVVGDAPLTIGGNLREGRGAAFRG